MQSYQSALSPSLLWNRDRNASQIEQRTGKVGLEAVWKHRVPLFH